MHISWLGQSCFKIETKSQGEDITVIVSPFDPEKTGFKLPRTLVADIVFRTEADAKYPVETKDGKKPFVIESPGEYEIKGIFIYVIPLTPHNGQKEYLLRIEAEELVLVHVGGLDHVPTEAELQELEGVDVLFVPVGGGEVLDGKKAAELTAELEPRIVLPMTYQIEGLKQKTEGVEPFLRAVGVNPERLPKLKLTRKDLPTDDMRVVVLEKV